MRKCNIKYKSKKQYEKVRNEKGKVKRKSKKLYKKSQSEYESKLLMRKPKQNDMKKANILWPYVKVEN